MRKEIRILRLACAVLAGISCIMCVWAVLSTIRISKLEAWIEKLENRPAAETQAAYDPDAPAAEFRGGVISAAEAAEEYALLVPYYEMLGMNEAEYEEDAKLDVLNMLVEEKILENKAREDGVYELDAAALQELESRVRVEYEELVDYYMAFRFDESKTEAQVREETIAFLNENGDSYEDRLRKAKADAWRDRLFEQVTADFSVDDASLRQLYDGQLESAEMIYSANYAEYESDCAAGKAVLWNPEGVRRVQALLVPFDEGQMERYIDLQALLAAGDAEKLHELDALYGELEAEGQRLLDRLKRGEAFENLLAESGYGNAEGIHISERSTIFGGELRDAAMALEAVGDLSGLVRCDEGLCILRYAGEVTPGPVAFEEVAEELRVNYTEELKLSHFNSTVYRWISEAEVKYYPENF